MTAATFKTPVSPAVIPYHGDLELWHYTPEGLRRYPVIAFTREGVPLTLTKLEHPWALYSRSLSLWYTGEPGALVPTTREPRIAGEAS